MPTINYSDACQNFKSLIDQVNEDRVPVTIKTKGEDNNVVLISEKDYCAMMETIHLFENPRNARRLLDSIDQLDANEIVR